MFFWRVSLDDEIEWHWDVWILLFVCICKTSWCGGRNRKKCIGSIVFFRSFFCIYETGRPSKRSISFQLIFYIFVTIL